MKKVQSERMDQKKASIGKKTAISGMTIAIYIVVMLLTQSFAFGQYQIRIATSLYALAAIYPFLIGPLGIANFLSNTLLGGLGVLDMIGGFLVGISTSYCCWAARKVHSVFIALPILLIPTFMVPLWLSAILQVPYLVLVLSVGAGQILPAIVGVLIAKYLEKPLLKI